MRAPPDDVSASIPTPPVPVPVTVPVAKMLSAFALPCLALIPLSAPYTDPAVIVIPPPLASLVALMPSPAAAVTEPLTLIEIAPPPELLATIPPCVPDTDRPLADWVNVMPPFPPVCVREKALPFPTFTVVSS